MKITTTICHAKLVRVVNASTVAQIQAHGTLVGDISDFSGARYRRTEKYTHASILHPKRFTTCMNTWPLRTAGEEKQKKNEKGISVTADQRL